MAFIQPLDLQNLLLNTLAGSTDIFVFLSYIIIAMASAKFGFSNSTFLIMILLWSVLMANYTGIIFTLILVMTGFIVFRWMAKIVKN